MAKSITANSIYNFALKFFRIIVPMLVGSYVIHTLDAQLYAEFISASTWLDFALIFGVFGVYTYGIREAAKIRDDREKSRRLFSSLFAINIVTNAVVLAAYSGVVLFSMGALARPIYLTLGIKVFANIFMVEWLNEALENYRFITIKTVLVRLVYAGLIFAFIHKPEDVVTYCLIIVVTDILNNVASFVYIQRKLPLAFKGLEIKRHILPLLSILVISNVNLLYTQLDKLLLDQTVSSMATTIYRIPQDITNLVSGLLASMVMVAVPRLAYYVNDRMEDYMALLNRSYHSFMLVVFPACVGFACLAKEVIQIYCGPGYDGAIPVLVVFSIRTIESSVYAVCANQIMYVRNQEKTLVRMLLACGVLNALLDLLMVAVGQYTPITAVLTTLASELVLMFILFRYIRNRLEIPFYFFTKTNLKYILLSLTFIPVTFAVHLLHLGNKWTAAIVIPVCMGVYFGGLLLLKDETMLFLFGKVWGMTLGRWIKPR